MRVLFVIAHLDKGGGQAVQCEQLFRRLAPRLDSAELLALSAKSPPERTAGALGPTIVGSIRFPGGIVDLRRAIRQRARQFDIVQAFDMYYALPAARLARAEPLVVRLGSDPVEDLASRWGVWGRGWMRLTVPWLFSGTDVVVNAPHLVPTLPTGRVQCIPNGVDTARFAERIEPGSARVALGVPAGAPLLAFTGKLLPRKNLEDAFWLLTQLPPVHLLLVGAQSEPYYGDRYFRQLQREFPSVLPRVHAVGEVSMDRIPRLLAAADIFLFPSRLEGMPNSVLEAMAAGLPVVASMNPAHREVVSPATGLLYTDRSELRTAVERLVADPSLRERMGRAGRARVQEQYSFEAAADRYLGLYARILRSS